MTGSNFGVVDANVTAPTGVPVVPISTPANDANGNTVPAHMTMFQVGSVAEAVSAASPLPVASTPEPLGMALTVTTVTLTANASAQLIGANANRKYLAIWVTGSGNLNLGFGTAAVANVGVIYGPGGDAIGREWGAATGVPTQAIYGISVAGTTVVVEEGN